MKSKFQNFDFGAVEVLSRDEAAKVKGGAYGNSSAGPGGGVCSTKYCYSSSSDTSMTWPPRMIGSKCNATALSGKADNCLWVCPTAGGSSCS